MELQLEIDRVGNFGQGVGTDPEGNVYFVPGALPGDKVRVLYRKAPASDRYRDAQLVEVLRPAPGRTDSICPYFTECGGCDWLQWDYEEQLKAKEAMVTHTLARLGLEAKERLPIVRAEKVLGYRSRIQVSRDGDKVGFYRRNTREVVDVENCAIARPEINALLQQVRQDKKSGRSREELFLDSSGKAHRRGIDLYGLDFAQIHQEQNEKLRTLVRQGVERAKSKTVIELFCGDGNLTFSYAPIVKRIYAVDSSKMSIEKARKAAIEARLPVSLEFDTKSVGYSLRHKLPQELQLAYDTLILDPPRQGIGDALREWVSSNLKNILYVSCSPTSFAQDINKIRELFSLTSIQAIDMFPQTRHVEVVAWLERR
jgi:23S rRNA (uracil1939-C5)-methyltransferase